MDVVMLARLQFAATCWQTPDLPAGMYFWKVFVRDARGYMNRTNQRPLALTIK